MGFAALVAISCADADTDVVENTNLSGHNLHTVTRKVGDVTLKMFEFTDNKMITETLYSGGGVDDSYVYTYNAIGDLLTMVGTRGDGYVFFERELVYDTQHRLTEIKDTSYNDIMEQVTHQNSTITYNDVNNTVTAQYGFELQSGPRVFHFNNNGFVSAVETGNDTIALTYDGNNITQWNQLNFTYDTTTPVKGEYLNMYRNQFKSYVNFIVYWAFPVPTIASSNYITSINEQPGTIGDLNYTYEFDANGYPTVVHEAPTSYESNVVDVYINYN